MYVGLLLRGPRGGPGAPTTRETFEPFVRDVAVAMIVLVDFAAIW